MAEKIQDRKIKTEEHDNKDDLEENEARYKESILTQNEILIKIETNQTDDFGEMQDGTVKIEKVDIKEDWEENEASYKEYVPKQEEDFEKMGIDQGINAFKEMHEIAVYDWRIKKEELDIKDDLEEKNISILPDCVCQDNRGKCEKCLPEKSEQLDDEISLKSGLFCKLSKVDHCMDNIIEETSLTGPHSQMEIKRFKCNKCDFQTNYKRNIKHHLLRHNQEQIQKFNCDHCSYKADFIHQLKKHLLEHKNRNEVLMYKCNNCDFQTKHKRYIKVHMLQHNQDQFSKFKCGQCSYKTNFKSQLNRHLLQHRNLEEIEKFKCNKCDFKTIHRGSFKRHLLRHNNSDDV